MGKLLDNWGYVYLVDYGDKKTFKIGRTSHLDANTRIKQIIKYGVIMPMKPVFYVDFDDSILLEKILHAKYWSNHEVGEWYNFTFPDLVDLYQTMKCFGRVT